MTRNNLIIQIGKIGTVGGNLSSTKNIQLRPIGFTRTKAIKKVAKERTNISEIILSEDLSEALFGIQGFSHIFVIFWMHEISEKEKRTIKVHPRGREDMPLQGVFSTRTPCRPNPIGLTLVELLKAKDNVLTVRGLDAYNGTPILDIKPFDYWDTVGNIRVPEWWKQLERERLAGANSYKLDK